MKFDLVVNYDDRFAEQVENENPNPLADFTIRVSEYDLTGASDNQFYLDDYMFFSLRKQLGAVEDILTGERRKLTLYSIPDDLILDPDDDTVFVFRRELGDVSEKFRKADRNDEIDIDPEDKGVMTFGGKRGGILSELGDSKGEIRESLSEMLQLFFKTEDFEIDEIRIVTPDGTTYKFIVDSLFE